MKESENELVVLEEVKYPVSTDDINTFLTEWKDIPTLDPLSEDKAPYKAVKKAHLAAIKFRTTIEAKRKLLKSPALQYGKQVDLIAKEFQEMINPKELELFAERNKVEQYEKEQEQLRINAERERVEEIGRLILIMQMIPSGAIGLKSGALTEIYEDVKIPSLELFSERTDEAMSIYKDVMLKLESMIETATKAEQAEEIQAEAEAKRKAEEAILEESRREEKEAFEREKSEFEREREAQQRQIQAQQEEINRQNAEREMAELENQQKEEAAKRAELAKEEQAERNKQNIAHREAKIAETLEVMNKYTDNGLLLNEIIRGAIPNIKWEV